MSNEIIKINQLPSLADNTISQQIGNDNINVNNENGGTVTFNVTVNYPSSQNNSGLTSEDMIAIEKFSKKYYQLLVTADPSVFENNIFTVITSRALSEYLVPKEIFESCSTLSDEGIEILKTFPAIICKENTGYNGETDSNQFAMYGYIKKVQILNKEIKIAFRPLAPIQQKLLCSKQNAIYFDLQIDSAITNLNHSSWSVHKANLFEAFKEAGIGNVPIPTKE